MSYPGQVFEDPDYYNDEEYNPSQHEDEDDEYSPYNGA